MSIFLSKRTLAVNLGISTITVENSYGQLMSEGYIYSVPKKGYYVSDISGVAKDKAGKNMKFLKQQQRRRPDISQIYHQTGQIPEAFHLQHGLSL